MHQYILVVQLRVTYKGWKEVQGTVADYLEPIFSEERGLPDKALEWVEQKKHIMKFVHLTYLH